MSASRRRSQRLSTGDSTESKHKRAASGSGPASQVTKKPKKQLSTPKKSQYFEPDSEADELAEDDSPSPVENDSSEFGEDAAVSEASDSPEDDEDEYDSHADSAPKKRRMSAKSTPNSVRAPAGENYKPGVTIIKKPKARPAGNVKYADETIHPNTLLFLKDLKANNNRPWLKCELSLRPSICLSCMCLKVITLCSVVMQQTTRSSGICPVEALWGGDCNIGHSIDMASNSQNAPEEKLPSNNELTRATLQYMMQTSAKLRKTGKSTQHTRVSRNPMRLTTSLLDFRHTFVEKMTETLSEIDDTVPELPVKECVFIPDSNMLYHDATSLTCMYVSAW